MSELGIAAVLSLLGASTVAVVLAGTALARAGDAIAEQTGLGRIFVGALFVAVATSLPELGTVVTAAASGSPDLAIGDLFGSNMANMAILAIVDLRYRGRVIPAAELGHARMAAIAIGLTAVALLGIVAPPGVDVLDVGITPIVLAIAYVAALAWFRRVPPIGVAVASPTPFHEIRPIRRRWTGVGPPARRFVTATVALVLAAPLLAFSSEEVARRSGLGEGLLGVSLLAVTTSMPELVTALAAVRIGAHDLAVGNLLGSNAANMAMIVAVDAAYRPGPVLAAVSGAQVVAGISAILLMSLALAALVTGRANRASRLEPDSIVILVVYLLSIAAVAVTE